MATTAEKTDRTGYDEHYKDNLSGLTELSNARDYVSAYEQTRIGPYYLSGDTKGFVRGAAIERLIAAADELAVPRENIQVVDAGFGQGELAVYLACLGFNVIGVDISAQAKECGELLADRIGVTDRCIFHAESLEDISVADSSVHFVIGHASLHHFIKYERVPSEFSRILRPGGKGFFADAFGENKLYHVFHDKKEMKKLGDVTLTKALIESYFKDFELVITPTDWFVMLDKLLLKALPTKWNSLVKKASRINNAIDRKVPISWRISLYLSGSVLTEITKPSADDRSKRFKPL